LAGEYGKLLELARSRMRESPGDVGPHYYVGVANYRVGAYREAEEAFEKVLEIDPGWQPGVQAYLERCRKKGSQEDGEAYRGGCRRRQAQPGVTEPAEGDYGLATEDTEAKENGQEIGVRGQGSAVRRSLSHAAPVLRPLSVTSVPSVAALPLTC
jgi:hypothetical protein